jgi:hypothetical protein
MLFTDNIMSTTFNIRPFYTLLILVSIQCFSQQAKPFKVRHQSYIKGDMTMIANNIVNTDENQKNANLPYNDRSVTGKLNDESSMKYIDIDNDNSTFSSSSADLILENKKNKKIVYAGLYWSATYLYNSGKITYSKKFKAKDSNREAFDKIKIKLPNQEQYNDITGELIFDGINDPNFSESAPYVMYADITKMVSNLTSPFGTYTIANIKSTVGSISGGISAGWSIFFVYEDPTMTGKFITSYDGFAGITDKSIDIDFSGFQTLPSGKVNAKIACAALEGDLKLKGDQLLFKTSKNNDFAQLSNTLRDKNNIFNSSITIENNFFDKRMPNSSNTLGYDSFIMNIENPDNSVIGNNIQDATVRLKTYGDRYFMFFNAFNVEVIMPDKLVKEEYTNLAATTNSTFSTSEPKNTFAKKSELTVGKNGTTTQIEENKTQISSNLLEIKKDPSESKTSENKNRITAIESPTVLIPSAPEAYYIIANVFSVPSNATRFIAALKKKGIIAGYFINPKNNYYYVYVSNHSNFDEASSYYNSNLDGKYFDALWIMTVNKSNSSTIVSNQKLPIYTTQNKVFDKEKARLSQKKLIIQNDAVLS